MLREERLVVVRIPRKDQLYRLTIIDLEELVDEHVLRSFGTIADQ